MPLVGAVPSSLTLGRSTQSGAKAMLAASAWRVVYTESQGQPYFFISAEIDLTTMAAGDSIDIQVRKQMVSGGAWTTHGQTNYIDAQPAGHLSAHIGAVANVYGVEISMRQTAGVLRAPNCEFFDAKFPGL